MTQQLAIYCVQDIANKMEQGKIVLRTVEPRHMRKIRNYVTEQFMTGDVFIPPIVASETAGILNIIDGSSRLRALVDIFPIANKMLLSEDPDEHKKGVQLDVCLGEVQLAFQIFEDFSEQEMDQLYIDLNTKGKKVALSKRIAYDSRNTINIVTNELLQQHEALRLAGVEQEKISMNRPANKKFLSLSQLRAIVSLFLIGKEIDSGIHTQHVDEELIEKRLPLINAWLDELFMLEGPENIGNYNISVLASFSFVRALAYYAMKGEERVPASKKEDYIRSRMKALNHINWETCQPLWEQFNGMYRGKDQLYFVNSNKKTLEAMIRWLCMEGGEKHVKK